MKIDVGEYLNSGGSFCPYCKSHDISGDSIDIEGSHAYQEVTCQECWKAWTDQYALVGVLEHDEEATPPASLDVTDTAGTAEEVEP